MRLNIQNFLVISLLAFLLQSCADPSKYGVVKTHGDKNSFMFLVSEDFSKKHKHSKSDPLNPRISKAESKLLSSLLERERICTDNSISPSYVITSKQEKIYDATYASLIEENYNAKSITPLTFYGRCR
ncbi:MAG: hypothetical protein ISQ34_02210 [Rickettsiales bacterium]|nr:hypothetical protein [Rickettsiales bacterium]